jgi:hypothetical protein
MRFETRNDIRNLRSKSAQSDDVWQNVIMELTTSTGSGDYIGVNGRGLEDDEFQSLDVL